LPSREPLRFSRRRWSESDSSGMRCGGAVPISEMAPRCDYVTVSV
jgi:hypothetical protein